MQKNITKYAKKIGFKRREKKESISIAKYGEFTYCDVIGLKLK